MSDPASSPRPCQPRRVPRSGNGLGPLGALRLRRLLAALTALTSLDLA